MCTSLLPGDSRRDVEIDVDSLVAAEVGADAVVGSELREGAGAARPLLVVVDFLGVAVVVVSVVEANPSGRIGRAPRMVLYRIVSMLSP